MSPLVRLCCALAALTLGCALYTSTVVSSAGGPAAGGNTAAAYAAPAAPLATPATALITVNSLSDAAANDGLCTLREAITSANTQTASGAASGECAAGQVNNIISVTVTGTISLTSALPDIASDVTINGTGARFLTVSGNNANRVFNIAGGATVTISLLTISGGSAYSGAGVNNSGTLTLASCVVSNNHAARPNNNPPLSLGGGVNNNGGGVLNISNSTIHGNSTSNFFGDSGGGLFNAGTATLTNTTVSANTAVLGGGIGGSGALTLANTTVTANRATYVGGGIQYANVGTLNVGNTIIAGNTADSSGPDCSAAITSQDYNLLGSATGCSVGGTTTHNLAGVDAKLGPLQDNGGMTPTHALLPNSPAVDAGNSALGADQRNEPRPSDLSGVANAAGGSGSDIGAFEAGPTELLTVNSLLDATDGTCDSQNCPSARRSTRPTRPSTAAPSTSPSTARST